MIIAGRLKQSLRAIFLGVDARPVDATSIISIELARPEGMRRYLKALPSRGGAPGKRPLVIVLHGAGASAAQVLGLAFPPSPLSLWLEIAEREQLVVVAPDGSRRRGERCWNDGNAGITGNPRTDDTGFIGAIIDGAIAEDDVDPARVYVMGVSKGGMMAYRVATEIGSRLAGFAAVLATMPVRSNCGLPATPVSALVIAGTADPFIPYDGKKFLYHLSAVARFIAPLKSVDESVSIWRRLAGLPAEPAITPLARRHAGDATRAIRYLWGSDPQALQVGLLRIDGGGHAEPSTAKRYPGLMKWFPGAQNADVEAAEEAWEFFKDKTCSSVS